MLIFHLLNAYCMSMYSRNLWHFNHGITFETIVFTACKKYITGIWELDRKTHNNSLHHINYCLPIEILHERDDVLNLFMALYTMNIPYIIHSRIVLYSFYNFNCMRIKYTIFHV